MNASDRPYPFVLQLATRVVTRFFWLILIIAGAISYYSFGVAKQLKLDTNIVSLMPDGVPSVENLDKVIKITGGYSNAMVVVDSPDPDAALEFLKALRQEVLTLDWVSSAEYEEDTAIFQRHQLLYVDVADLEEVRIRCEGSNGVCIDSEGRLVVDTALGKLVQKPPVSWVVTPNGEQRSVECRFRVHVERAVAVD